MSDLPIVAAHKLAFGDSIRWTRKREQQIHDALALEPAALACSCPEAHPTCNTIANSKHRVAEVRIMRDELEWISHNCQQRCISHVINDRINLPLHDAMQKRMAARTRREDAQRAASDERQRVYMATLRASAAAAAAAQSV